MQYTANVVSIQDQKYLKENIGGSKDILCEKRQNFSHIFEQKSLISIGLIKGQNEDEVLMEERSFWFISNK